MINNLLKRNFEGDSESQVARQFLGKLVNPLWENEEIILSRNIEFRGRNATNIATVVCCVVYLSNSEQLNIQIIEKINEVNTDLRIIAVSKNRNLLNSLANHVEKDQLLERHNTLLFLLDGFHPMDTVLNIMAISSSYGEGEELIYQVILNKLKYSKFSLFMGLNLETQSFIATALRYPDVSREEHDPNIAINEFRTIYPSLRDHSDFRGLLVQANFNGRDFTCYKESAVHDVSDDKNRALSVFKNFVRVNQ